MKQQLGGVAAALAQMGTETRWAKVVAALSAYLC